MKNSIIILSTVLVIVLSGVIAFNSSGKPSGNNEGLTNAQCTCNCR